MIAHLCITPVLQITKMNGDKDRCCADWGVLILLIVVVQSIDVITL